jgi:WhiB family redox-sensing transcriptional regulator
MRASSFEEYEMLMFMRLVDSMRPSFYFDGLCLDSGLENFFPGQGKSHLAKKAVALCNTCPVQDVCFKYALENKVEYGIWGGASQEDRKKWLSSGTSEDDAWQEFKKD